MKFLSKTEKQKLNQGHAIVVGCDEVGRGSLAGPVVAAAVAWKFSSLLKYDEAWRNQITDSKLLSPAKRTELAGYIQKSCLSYGFGQVGPEAIDKINIHQASLQAMRKAVGSAMKKVSSETSERVIVLVDGKFFIPNLLWKQEAFIDGDARLFSVGAASIVAKVYRDNLMVKLHEMFPGYGLARHKGYGTELHRNSIRTIGLSSIHRASFCGKIA